MWYPDGTGTRGKFGVLTPHLDPVPETELQTMAPQGVSIHAARVPLGMVGPDGQITPHVGPEIAKAFSEPPGVDNAVGLVTPLEPNAIIYAFTSSSYILGPRNDSLLKVRLEDRSAGIPIVVQTTALVSALRALGTRTIALIHPPWFTIELDELGATYFKKEGFEVVYHGPAKLRNDYGDIVPEQIYEWTTRRVPDEAESVVLGGGGFRAIGAIDALETALDRPVLSANQAAFWYALNVAGVADPVKGYGRIFDTKAISS